MPTRLNRFAPIGHRLALVDLVAPPLDHGPPFFKILRVIVTGAHLISLGMGKLALDCFRSDDLCGVVDPDEQDHDRRRSAVAPLEPLGADVLTDGEPSEVEQQCGDHGAW